MANAFNNFFVTIAEKLKDPVIVSDFKYIIDYVNTKVPPENYFSIPLISEREVCKYLKQLDVAKSTGLDTIGPRLLKKAAPFIAEALTMIINKSILQSSFPNLWKSAKVKPLFKSGDKDSINNYRPISILPTVSKIIEKHVHDAFMCHINNFNLFHNTQSGFRKQHSTETALAYLRETWLRAINEGKVIGALLVDFKKAFDLVDHNILIKKLKIYKCNNSCIEWFRSYLSNRHQRVQINNQLSSFEEILTCGVPQGSILGPLLFLIFINDLPLIIGHGICSTDLYADDTTIYDIQSDKSILESNLNTALSGLQKWCATNGMQINTDKTKVMFISTQQKRRCFENDQISLFYKDFKIDQSSCEKILGVHFQNDLKWDFHVKAICKKISSYIWLLSKIKDFLPINYRTLFYKAYIQPHLDYCSILWGNTVTRNIKMILKLQKRACRTILGNEYIDFDSALQKLNIQRFDKRLIFNKAVFMYKVAHNLLPDYICNMYVPCDRLQFENHTLRSHINRNFCIPMPHLELYKNSLLYSGSCLWNRIPKEIKNAYTVDTFKTLYLQWTE
jgi:hypothetical protein